MAPRYYIPPLRELSDANGPGEARCKKPRGLRIGVERLGVSVMLMVEMSPAEVAVGQNLVDPAAWRGIGVWDLGEEGDVAAATVAIGVAAGSEE